jgi:hypothetical protein
MHLVPVREAGIVMDVLRWMKGACVVTAVLGAVGYLLFLARMLQELDRPVRWFDNIDKWLQAALPPLLVIILSAIGYSLCCLAERFRLPRASSPLEQDYEDRPQASPSFPPPPQVGW